MLLFFERTFLQQHAAARKAAPTFRTAPPAVTAP